MLPLTCLKNYQVIYDETKDNEHLTHDDNQVYSDRSTVRSFLRESSSVSTLSRTFFSRVPSRGSNPTSVSDIVISREMTLPKVEEVESNKSAELKRKQTPKKISIENIEDNRSRKASYFHTTFSYARPTISSQQQSMSTSVKRSLSSNTVIGFSRTKRVDLKPLVEKKIDKNRESTTPYGNISEKSDSAMFVEGLVKH